MALGILVLMFSLWQFHIAIERMAKVARWFTYNKRAMFQFAFCLSFCPKLPSWRSQGWRVAWMRTSIWWINLTNSMRSRNLRKPGAKLARRLDPKLPRNHASMFNHFPPKVACKKSWISEWERGKSPRSLWSNTAVKFGRENQAKFASLEGLVINIRAVTVLIIFLGRWYITIINVIIRSIDDHHGNNHKHGRYLYIYMCVCG